MSEPQAPFQWSLNMEIPDPGVQKIAYTSLFTSRQPLDKLQTSFREKGASLRMDTRLSSITHLYF